MLIDVPLSEPSASVDPVCVAADVEVAEFEPADVEVDAPPDAVEAPVIDAPPLSESSEAQPVSASAANAAAAARPADARDGVDALQ